MTKKEQKQHELTERVKKELQPGESLLYCEQPTAANAADGVLFMLIGIVFIVAAVYIGIMGFMEEGRMYWQLVLFMLIGLSLGPLSFIAGYKRTFSNEDVYNFVTDKRLCIRARKEKQRDFALSEIKDFYLDTGHKGRAGGFSTVNITMHDNQFFNFHPWNHIKMNEALSSAVNRNKQEGDVNG